jgi:hypothetical protein
MKGYNDTLAAQCLQIALEVWKNTHEKRVLTRVPLAVELLITTGDKQYADFLVANTGGSPKHRQYRLVGRANFVAHQRPGLPQCHYQSR